MRNLLKKYSRRSLFADLICTVLGSAIVGFALAVFTVPNDIAPGGVSGLATALAHITPIRVSVWALILNVPLLLAAWRMLGIRPLVFTLLSTFLLSGFIELFTFLIPGGYTNDVLTAALFGGAIAGVGLGLLLIRGLSTGGTDLLTLLVRKFFPNIANGSMLLFIDATVVLVATLVFREIDVALYSAITLIVASKLIDIIAQGVDYAKVVYAITDKGDEVTKALITHLDRGVTIIPATGGYTGTGKQIVMTVSRRNYLAQTIRLIKATDPKAFTFVVNSTEVHGEGFKPVETE